MNRDKHFWWGLLILLVPYLFWLMMGEDAYVLIHDNLDSEFVYIKHLLESGNVLGFDLNHQIGGVMNGLDRSFFRSGFNLTFLLFSLFPPVVAYIINHAIVHVIGYCGMYLLLRRYTPLNNSVWLTGCSLIFGFLSYYHIQYGVSISGQPLLLYAFLNLLHKSGKASDWTLILLFPFFSFLPVTLPFMLPVLVGLGVFHFIKTKQWSVGYILAITALTLLNVLVEFNLVQSFLFSGKVSHRSAFDIFITKGQPPFVYYLKSLTNSTLLTYVHSGKMWLFPFVLALPIVWLVKKRIPKKALLLIKVVVCIMLVAPFSALLVHYADGLPPVMKSIPINRLSFFIPLLLVALLAVLLSALNQKERKEKHTAILLIAIALSGAVVNNKELVENVKMLARVSSEPTFKEYFAQGLFENLKHEIGDDTLNAHNVISLGFFPSIAQYNGFATLDSYQNNYELDYKHKFRRIIAAELEENEELKVYFDFWGSRCYAMSKDLGKKFDYDKSISKPIAEPNYDWNVFLEMQGQYIISSIPLVLKANSRLKKRGEFESSNSYWKFYLYKVE